MKLRHKKMILGAALCLAAAVSAVSVRSMTSQAADWVVSWSGQGESRSGSAKLTVQLPPEEKVDQASTFRLRFRLETESGEAPEADACTFAFERSLKKSSGDIVIQDYRYEDGVLEILVAGRKAADGTGGVLNKKEPLILGTITVTCQEDVTVTPESGQAVDESGELAELSELGGSYVIEGAAPVDPDESESPSEPSNPDESESPSEPSNPDESESPSEPSDPDESESPSEPSVPGESEAPGETKPGGSSGGSGSHSSDRDSDNYAGVQSAVPGQTIVETKGTWSQAGDGSWRFRRANGTLVRDEWICVQGSWYRMDSNGAMKTGWYENLGQTYYLKESGAMQTGWLNLQGEWYFFGADGRMQTGWIQTGDQWYYLNPVRPTVTYLQDPVSGAWMESIGDQMPYGAMYKNTTTPDGYPVDGNGAWIR